MASMHGASPFVARLPVINFPIPRCTSPGRFFAAHELKMMMAHLVLTYDLKLENPGVRPKDTWFGTSRIPNADAEVMFRKRRN